MIARPGDIGPGGKVERSRAPRYWTVGDLLSWTEEHFRKLGLPAPRLDAELLLASAMASTRLDLYTGYRKVVEEGERARFRELVKRRARFEPVAYILGYREFYSLRIEVDPAVLIPRPETELLVERAIAELDSEPRAADGPPARILDLGTGSGNIAIALAVNLPAAQVTAVDISPEAIEVARRNAGRHGVGERIDLLTGDLFEPLLAREPRPVFDAIVSNPPYVSLSDYPKLMPDVREYEPAQALIDKKSGTGLGYYRDIIRGAAPFLSPRGLLAFEVGAAQAREVEAMLGGSGWSDIRTSADYAGIPRVVTARIGS